MARSRAPKVNSADSTTARPSSASSRHDAPLKLLGRFADRATRTEASKELARWLGADEVIVFLRDPELGVLLPAPGAPKTIAGGPAWRAFLRAVKSEGLHRGEVDMPPETRRQAIARVTSDGAALVAIGGAPDEQRLELIADGIPLLGALARAEHARRIAEGEKAIAAASGRNAHDLAQALDNVRTELERALKEAAHSSAELREADRRKDEFLAMLAHELRNPMAAISGALAVARMRPDDRGASGRALSLIDRQTEQLARLVDDLLDVSRISRGKITLRREPTRADEIMRRSLDSVESLISDRSHEISIDIEEEVWVDADPTRLEQIVTNLLTNAAKYTNPGGKISACLRRQGATAVLIVEDNGIGIPATMRERVFEPFFQLDRASDRGPGGLGLGLTLVKRLVELHGGSIEVSSPADQGSTFTLRLPTTEPPAASAVDEPAQMDRAASKCVLVVDDNVDAGEMTTELLRAHGHDAIHVADGPAALESAARRPPDVVFLDIGLPGMDGYEVAARLRGLVAARELRIIAVSGYGQEDDRRKARAAGCDDHFVKPVDPHKLVRAVAD